MATKVHISPKILNSIASLYNDTNRIFMEYIDNSIDSADQHYYNQESKSYSRPIEILLKIEGTTFKNGRVIILDNCFGITNFTKIVSHIGNSDKKEQAWTNGQFGYGIYSFMAACEKLEVTSKLENESAVFLPISRKEFDKPRQEDISLPDPKVLSSFDSNSGTKIVLSEFDKEMWKAVNVKNLKEEIEKHFELILSRKNLQIKLIDASGNKYVCAPFNYDSLVGEVYDARLTDLHINKKQGELFETKKIENPIHIFLKMTKGITTNKPPVFISKGRRICEIKDVKSFKSTHKNDIWGHPNVTGYIDLNSLLGPTIARTDFRNDKDSRMVYQTLFDLEDLILEHVQRVNTETEERHYQQLEDVLNKALSKLARMDAMSYRTEYLPGGKTDLAGGAFGMSIGDEFGDKQQGDGDEIENPSDDINDLEDNSGLSAEAGKLPSDSEGGENPKNEQNKDESEFAGEPRKKSGFNVKISEEDPQVDGATGKAYRSIWDGSYIIIYKNHPDFQARVSHSHQGETKITERLISYLASEITVHYKDLFFNKMNNGQPDYSKAMFESFVDFIYQFEKMLQDFRGKNLSELK